MMNAQELPQNDARRNDPIARFEAAYGDALEAARISAEHTATEGWQRLYHGRMTEDRKRRKELAERLKALCTTLEDVGLDEDGEKSIGEVKKEATAVREQQQAFKVDVIGPVCQPVYECHRIIDEARREARRIELDAPLVNVGLEELMRAAIAAVPPVEWDAESGRVTVLEPADA